MIPDGDPPVRRISLPLHCRLWHFN